MSWAGSGFMDDLYEISDFKSKATMPVRTIPVSSKHMQYARSKPSIYDPEEVYDDYNITPQQSPGTSGRGRGYAVRRPGSRSEFLQNQDDTAKCIRQVNGLGYSNHIIEHLFQRTDNNSNFNQNDMASIKVGETSPTSSTYSTPTSSPFKKPTNTTNVKDSEVKAFDMSTIKLKVSPSSSARSTPTIAPTTTSNMILSEPSATKAALSGNRLNSEPTTNIPSLGLFDMIKAANSEPLKGSTKAVVLETTTTELQKVPSISNKVVNVKIDNPLRPQQLSVINYTNPVSYQRQYHTKEKFLDINSKTEFPPL